MKISHAPGPICRSFFNSDFSLFLLFCYRPINTRNTGIITHIDKQKIIFFYLIYNILCICYEFFIHKNILPVHIEDHALAHEKQRRIVVNSEKINCVHQKLLLVCCTCYCLLCIYIYWVYFKRYSLLQVCKQERIVAPINRVSISGLHVKSPILVIDKLMQQCI